MGERNPGKRGATQPGADAGDDAERDGGGGERQGLLASPPEHQRIAALEPQDPQVLARKADQPLIDAKLRSARPTSALAHRLQPCRTRQPQDFRRYQRVMQDDVGNAQGMDRMQREQARITGPSAGKPHRPGLEGRRDEASGGQLKPGASHEDADGRESGKGRLRTEGTALERRFF